MGILGVGFETNASALFNLNFEASSDVFFRFDTFIYKGWAGLDWLEKTRVSIELEYKLQ